MSRTIKMEDKTHSPREWQQAATMLEQDSTEQGL